MDSCCDLRTASVFCIFSESLILVSGKSGKLVRNRTRGRVRENKNLIYLNFFFKYNGCIYIWFIIISFNLNMAIKIKNKDVTWRWDCNKGGKSLASSEITHL